MSPTSVSISLKSCEMQQTEKAVLSPCALQSQHESRSSHQHFHSDPWQTAQNITFWGSSPPWHHERTLKSRVDQTICVFSTDYFPMAANPRVSLYSKCTLIHLEALISEISGESMCLNMDVHFDWHVPLDLFHTYTYIYSGYSQQLRAAVLDPIHINPSFPMKRMQKKQGSRGMLLGRGDENSAGMEGNRRSREMWWAHKLALYAFSVLTNFLVQLSLCVGLHYWLRKLFLSLAGYT